MAQAGVSSRLSQSARPRDKMWSAEAWPYQQSGWFPLKAGAPQRDLRCMVFPDSIFESL